MQIFLAAKIDTMTFWFQLHRLVLLCLLGAISITIGQFVPFPAYPVIPSSTPWYHEKLTWSLKTLDRTQLSKVVGSINVTRLTRSILPYFLVVRPPGSTGSKNVQLFIKYVMKDALKWTVEEDSFLATAPNPYGEINFTNVIATLNPSAKRRLVLACHMDSKVTPANFLGATDSAVPCSMLLEIAIALRNVISLSQYKSKLTLQFIFFDGEEAFVKWTETDSLYGSRHLADKWQRDPWPTNDPYTSKKIIDSIDLLMLLDLLGASNPKFYNNRIVSSTHFDKLIEIEKDLFGSNTYFQTAIQNTYTMDDHIPFHRRNVKVLHVIPKPFPPQWHTLYDNFTNLDSYSIDRLTKIFAVFVARYLHLNL